MLVKIEDVEETNKYIRQFGAQIVNDKVDGDLILSLLYPRTVYQPDPDHDVGKVALKMLKSMVGTGTHLYPLSLYLGNAPERVRREFTNNDFFIDEYNIVAIKDTVYEIYEYLLNLRDTMSISKVTVPYVSLLIDNWPTVLVRQNALPDDDNSCPKPMPKFDYHVGAMKFHTSLPIDTDKDTVDTVLVDVIRNEDDSAFKYTVHIADHPPILTDELPEPDTINDLLRYSKTWRYKLNKYIKYMKRRYYDSI